MGRTLPSFMQVILREQSALAKFRRALRKEDQEALDDLFRMARYQVASMAYASHALPLEVMLLAMLVEEHKRVLRLEEKIQKVIARSKATKQSPTCLEIASPPEGSSQ